VGKVCRRYDYGLGTQETWNFTVLRHEFDGVHNSLLPSCGAIYMVASVVVHGGDHVETIYSMG
jgi:hypothetical protein